MERKKKKLHLDLPKSPMLSAPSLCHCSCSSVALSNRSCRIVQVGGVMHTPVARQADRTCRAARPSHAHVSVIAITERSANGCVWYGGRGSSRAEAVMEGSRTIGSSSRCSNISCTCFRHIGREGGCGRIAHIFNRKWGGSTVWICAANWKSLRV